MKQMGKKIKIFTKPDCANCPPAKKLGEEMKEEGTEVEMYNVEEAEGLAEAQIYSVLATPTIVLCDSDEEEIESWRGKPPNKEEVKSKMK